MSYTKINFENKPSKKSPISAENLNHMEQGISDAHVSVAELEAYKANSILSKASGEVVTTTDSAKVKPKNIKLFGKGKQRQYEGNQLFDISKVISRSDSSGASITRNEDDSLTIQLVSTASFGYQTLSELAPNLVVGETYTLNAITTGKAKYIIAGETWLFGTSKTITEEMLNANVRWYVSGNAEAGTCTISDIMINKGATALPWEPYVGNEPSPSMNYPQKPQFLGESGSIGGKEYGKNFADTSKLRYWGGNDTVERVDNGFYIKPTNNDNRVVVIGCDMRKGNIYRLSYDFENLGSESISDFNYYLTGVDNTLIFDALVSDKVFAPQIDIKEIAIYTDLQNPNIIVKITNVQVELGDTATSYELYKQGQPFTFQTPNGLRGIPLGQTIPDAIKNSPIHMSGVYWDGEQYQIADTENEDGKDVQRIGECIITENEYWQAENDSFGGQLPKAIVDCCLFTHGVRGVQFEYSGSVGWFHWNKDYNEWSTLEEWKENIAGKTFYYVLIEPIITDTTVEEKSQLDALVMNYPNTTIVNDAGAYMEVEYVCDTKEHIKQNYVSKEAHQEHENRIAELEKAIVNS